MMMSGPPGSGDDIQREGEDGVGPVDAASANELKEPSSVAEGIAERSSREEGAEGQREEEESAALEEADVRYATRDWNSRERFAPRATQQLQGALQFYIS